MIIGIDVDLTLVDSLTPWITWYKFKTGHDLFEELESGKDHGFNIQKLMINHDDPLAYWKQKDLYDSLTPLEGSITAVRKMMEDHTVIFVSHCHPEHIESKTSFLKRYYGPDIKLIDTKHKEYVLMDCIIDDHSEFLLNVKNIQPNCLLIQKKTQINSIQPEVEYSFSSWFEIIGKYGEYFGSKDFIGKT